ncbi:frizzled 5 [Trichuris trichiura]|uniref:Frizzled 5 n=1 Tax=Trichuris trichiura TaxID=36087 RepID=A0A077Z8U6_TRITR|nr:frizzled 5 [Trichuris trichiura]
MFFLFLQQVPGKRCSVAVVSCRHFSLDQAASLVPIDHRCPIVDGAEQPNTDDISLSRRRTPPIAISFCSEPMRRHWSHLVSMVLAAALLLWAKTAEAAPYSTSLHAHHHHHNQFESRRRCQEITIPMCKSIGYNMTQMPNQFNHQTQEDAGMEVHQFWPLVEINCSPDLRFFLCSMYTPICIPDYPKPLPACRSVCERARAGCAPLMRQYGFDWPPNLDCDRLPVFGQPDQLCMDANQTERVGGSTIRPTSSSRRPPIGGDLSDAGRGSHRGCVCQCRAPFVSLAGNDPSLNRASVGNVSQCTYPCRGLFMSSENHHFVTFWIGLWAVLCFLSTVVTVITFLIDMSRFYYPERPIIFLSFCYLMVSTGYLIRLIVGHDAVACDGNAIRTTSGDGSAAVCTIVFLLTYFFSMASSVWWVVLALTWFLAAGLKWSNEAISGYSPYFHMFAWALPSIKTVAILALSAVDGDPISGICSVGNTDVTTLRWFVLGPLFAYLVLGVFFLLAGFVSLVRIHHIVKQQQGVGKIEKLEKLMVRIGIFSVLYTIPATILIGCYFYEQHYRLIWEMTITCHGSDCGFAALTTISNGVHVAKPEFSIAVLKYFMCLVVGITSGIWIWSPKTVDSWRRFCYRLCLWSRSSDDQLIMGTTRGGKPLYVPAETIIIKSHTDVSNGAAAGGGGGVGANSGGGGYGRHYPVNHL